MPWRDILYDYFAYELISLFICSATQLVICIFERCFERDILVQVALERYNFEGCLGDIYF
jgi:hypothetical protein